MFYGYRGRLFLVYPVIFFFKLVFPSSSNNSNANSGNTLLYSACSVVFIGKNFEPVNIKDEQNHKENNYL